MIDIITTQRLVIKPFGKEDREKLSELLMNEEIKKTYMVPDFPNQEALDKMVDRFVELSLSEKCFVRGIYLDRYLVGVVNNVEIKDDFIELGYAIHPAFWGRGIATEMLKAVIQELLDTRFSRIRTGAFCENVASTRVMEKCGMQKIEETEYVEYRGKKHLCVYYEIKG